MSNGKRVGGRTHDQTIREWRDKYAREYTPGEMAAVDRRWRSLGKMIEHGPAVYIPDGWDSRRRR